MLISFALSRLSLCQRAAYEAMWEVQTMLEKGYGQLGYNGPNGLGVKAPLWLLFAVMARFIILFCYKLKSVLQKTRQNATLYVSTYWS